MNFPFIEYCDFQKKCGFVLLPAVQVGALAVPRGRVLTAMGPLSSPLLCVAAAQPRPSLRLCMAAALRPRSAAIPSVQNAFPSGPVFLLVKRRGEKGFQKEAVHSLKEVIDRLCILLP